MALARARVGRRGPHHAGDHVRSRREQIAEAKRLGLRVEPVRRTGEIRFLVPGEPPVTMNNRRTDGTRAVEKLLSKRRASDNQSHSDDDPPDA